LSRTIMKTFSVVPDLGGFPPSTAVRINLCSCCFSRSRDFCNTKNGIFKLSKPSNILWKYVLYFQQCKYHNGNTRLC
uniref:Uncharacterized protein n=1 Tax=Lates calcarifer TaxID=8187 RepID=A0A4W6BZY5_LATCA